MDQVLISNQGIRNPLVRNSLEISDRLPEILWNLKSKNFVRHPVYFQLATNSSIKHHARVPKRSETADQ